MHMPRVRILGILYDTIVQPGFAMFDSPRLDVYAFIAGQELR